MIDSRRLVGFGLDYNQQPPPVMRRLASRFGHRLSHTSVVAVSTEKEARTFDSIFEGMPHVHHLSNVAPADADGPHLDRLAHLDRLSTIMKSVWAGEDIGAWSIGPFAIPYFAPPLFERDVARLVGERIRRVNEAASIPFLAEIPSCTLVAGRISLGEFFHELVRQSDCGIVLDVSHVFAYANYRGEDPRAVMRSIPLDNVRELHVAGGSVKPDLPYYYRDTHAEPILPEVEDLVGIAVDECRSLRAVTYEFAYTLTDDEVDRELTRLERLLTACSFSPTFPPAAQAVSATTETVEA